MNKRYIGALMMAPFIIFVFLGGYYLEILSFIVSLIGLSEFYNVLKNKKYNPLKFVGYIATVIYYFLLIKNSNINHSFTFIVLITLILLCIPVIKIEYNLIDVSLTLIGVIYVTIFFGFIPMTNLKINGNYLVWLIFISAWSCDTFAYYSGRFFGKHKLCPKVSPNKTIEGSIGGMLGSALIILIYGLFIQKSVYIMPVYNYLIIGLLCGVICQFGDLVASSIKRYIDVKDYSQLIPGHGGILDRFDSIVYSAVITYYYLTLIVGL